MDEKLRFTGDWPSLQLWRKYPNWELALDEEDVEDQDETTIKPALQQQYIDGFLGFTLGEAVLFDGRKFVAYLEISNGEVNSVDIDRGSEKGWCYWFDPQKNLWQPQAGDWLDKKDWPPPLSDRMIFPIKVTTVLPEKATNKPRFLTIG